MKLKKAISTIAIATASVAALAEDNPTPVWVFNSSELSEREFNMTFQGVALLLNELPAATPVRFIDGTNLSTYAPVEVYWI